MNILVTGAAGFIGFHLVRALLDRGDRVTGLDCINDYYDPRLKYGRLSECGIMDDSAGAGDSASGGGGTPQRRDDSDGGIPFGAVLESSRFPGYRFIRMHLEDREALAALVREGNFDCVVNLAAQAGVRYSIENPHVYLDSNIVGFLNILEACKAAKIPHLVYASTSSVYGLNGAMPFSTDSNVNHPVSLYAASKKANELMAHTYSHLFGLPTTGLRFFTVYGPWGRPDMALFLFTRAILAGKPIDVFNHGNMKRDFTYVGDIVEGVIRVIDRPPAGNTGWDAMNPDPGSSPAPYKVYNIGNSAPVALMDYIGALEAALGRTAEKNMLPMQPGDVPATWADTTDLERDTGYKPETPVTEGIARFVEWYRRFYDV